MSRVPVYFTFAPVCCSHGWTIFRKAVCSSPPQVPITVTVLPLRSVSFPDELLLEQPAAAIQTTVNGTSRRSHGFMSTPFALPASGAYGSVRPTRLNPSAHRRRRTYRPPDGPRAVLTAVGNERHPRRLRSLDSQAFNRGSHDRASD